MSGIDFSSAQDDSFQRGDRGDPLEADLRFVWHPFTQHAGARAPICVKSAKGTQLFDVGGKTYLDMISSWWVNIHGHCDPEINGALSLQASRLEHVMFAGFTHEPGAQLAQVLAHELPGELNRVFYSDNGSTAVEVALKMAYQYWLNRGERGRTRIAALSKGYHGDTFGAMSVGRKTGYFRHFHNMLFPVDFLPVAETWHGDPESGLREARALADIEKHFERHGRETCALILEPLIQGAGGMRFYSEDFMREVSMITRRNGVLLIFDEVMTGFGRTGFLFASELLEDPPDIVCLSKGLTGGYLPLGATVVKDGIFAAFLGESPMLGFAHGHSFTGNPLSCAVALKSLELIKSRRCMEKVAEIQGWFEKYFLPLGELASLVRVRFRGGVAAVDLQGRSHRSGATTSRLLEEAFLRDGFVIRPFGKTIYLMPPYCVREDEIARACRSIRKNVLALVE